MVNCSVFHSVFHILCLRIINLLSYKMISAAYVLCEYLLFLLLLIISKLISDNYNNS